MNESCLLFAEKNAEHIVRRNLCRNFLLHLVSMHDFNLVSTLTIERAMARIRLLQSQPGQRNGTRLRQEDAEADEEEEEEEEDWETAEESQPDPDPDTSEDRAASEGTSGGRPEKKDQSLEGSAAADRSREHLGWSKEGSQTRGLEVQSHSRVTRKSFLLFDSSWKTRLHISGSRKFLFS